MHALPAGIPAGGIGPAKAIEQLQRGGQRHVIGCNLHVEQRHVHVEEEIEIHMGHAQPNRRVTGPQGDIEAGHIGTPINRHRRLPAGLSVGKA